MQPFKINQQVKLASVNPRAEIHGEERKAAYDLKFEAQCPASVLSHFDPELAALLYKKPDDPDLAEQADPDAATSPRFPKMSGFKWDYETTGNKLVIDYGLGGDSNITLSDTKLDKFSFMPQNGGTVLVMFRAIVHPETAHVGLLCDRIQQNIDLVIEPLKPQEEGDLLKGARTSKKTTKAEAEAQFSGQPAPVE
ncbi:hypothetical protein DBR37_01745 [Herminiimonas sp. KBW02]|uniref:hypothetical protein n=1 Tax=Herminiimonas sp. KBW02 TaxID=2153363 RepID=UPI000F5AA4B2|nr:hypothetical protein [Herminiimonas sp. KBW02]RQO38642.1 hypothetical protein DBR37_01745 [Herminiimonas sp. KBW02]